PPASHRGPTTRMPPAPPGVAGAPAGWHNPTNAARSRRTVAFACTPRRCGYAYLLSVKSCPLRRMTMTDRDLAHRGQIDSDLGTAPRHGSPEPADGAVPADDAAAPTGHATVPTARATVPTGYTADQSEETERTAQPGGYNLGAGPDQVRQELTTTVL